jgi:UDPglucose--hexose-1-phosphate uridylyltransferase
MSELRWNPLLGEWTVTATHRQDRTFFPPPGYCPLCPTVAGGFPTEVPAEDYDIVVFENKFPSLQTNPPEPAIAGTDLYPVRAAQGVCEVVVYTPEHNSSLAQQPLAQIYKLLQVWRDRFEELNNHDFVEYVFIFENKGEAVGVSNPHPHCQIYATNFVFKYIETEARVSQKHLAETGRVLFQDILAAEREDRRRIICENATAVAFVPYFARYAYEVYVAPKATHPSLASLSDAERRDFADVLRRVLVKFDNLWRMPFPYVMPLHQAPTDGGDYSGFHFHIEFHPPLRRPNLLKYLAGPEIGGGNFLSDTSPEEKAAELRAAADVHYKKVS